MSECAVNYLNNDVQCNEELLHSVLPQIEKVARQLAFAYNRLSISEDDLQQEGFLALINAADRYNPSMGVFAAYAVVVAKNAMLNVIHREKMRFEHQDDDRILSLLDENGDPSNITPAFLYDAYSMTPEQIVIRKETFEAVHHALNAVSARDKTYLWYRFGFDGEKERSMARAAEHFHLSERNGQRTEREALKKVKKVLKGRI